MLRYIASGLLVIGGFGLFAQNKFVPTSIRFGTELALLGITAFNSDRSAFEFTTDIDFHKYYLSFDYGYADRIRNESKYIYQSTGNYFRIGPDINFLYYDKRSSVLFLGVRYARSNYDDKLTFLREDPSYGTLTIERENNDLEASWVELLIGLKVRIWKELYMGYNLRFKFSRSFEVDNLFPFDIPGYGSAEDRSRFDLNYYIYYKIKWKEKPIPPKPRDKRRQ